MDIQEILDKTLPGLGYELVDFELTPQGTLRVFIDNETIMTVCYRSFSIADLILEAFFGCFEAGKALDHITTHTYSGLIESLAFVHIEEFERLHHGVGCRFFPDSLALTYCHVNQRAEKMTA